MRRRTGAPGELNVRAEINVTSLVDVAFTLLVIFIITAPVLQGGVEVAVPQGPVGVVEASEDRIFVDVRADNSIHVDERRVEVGELDATLARLIAEKDAQGVYVRGDSMALYGRVAPVIGAVAAREGVALWLIMEEVRR